MSETRTFRGSVVRWRYQSNLIPWGGRLLVATEVCRLRSCLGRQDEIHRSETALVSYEKIRNLAAWRSIFTFFSSDGEKLGLSFIPSRPERVRRALVEDGWPVRIQYLGLRGSRWESAGPEGN